jgi:hypothetical protein
VLAGVVIKELSDDDEEEEEEEEEAAPAARGKGKPAADDHTKNFLPLDGKKRAAPAAAAPPAKKAASAAAPAPAAAAAKAGAKPGSQFADGPAGSLGSRKFDNGLEIINLSAGKPDGKVALAGKRCVPALRARACASLAAAAMHACLRCQTQMALTPRILCVCVRVRARLFAHHRRSASP